MRRPRTESELDSVLYHRDDARSARDDAFADRRAEADHEPSAVDAADRIMAARERRES